MSFALILQILWPISVIAIPFVVGAGILWLKSLFPTRAELEAAKKAATDAVAVTAKAAADALASLDKELTGTIQDHAGRFERGSAKFADHDKRIALVEEECKSVPSRQTLQGELSQVAQRLRGVEVGFEGVSRQLGTTNDYLKIIVDKGLKP